MKKEKGSTKEKSAAKIKSADDSDLESGSESGKEGKRGGGGGGGFNVRDRQPALRKNSFTKQIQKPMGLSEPLSALLGETQLSRPQTVKRIWEYVKERDLQDPSDRRQIRCDDAMRAVFKSDRVHMFTMNKILSQNLYALDE